MRLTLLFEQLYRIITWNSYPSYLTSILYSDASRLQNRNVSLNITLFWLIYLLNMCSLQRKKLYQRSTAQRTRQRKLLVVPHRWVRQQFVFLYFRISSPFELIFRIELGLWSFFIISNVKKQQKHALHFVLSLLPNFRKQKVRNYMYNLHKIFLQNDGFGLLDKLGNLKISLHTLFEGCSFFIFPFVVLCIIQICFAPLLQI